MCIGNGWRGLGNQALLGGARRPEVVGTVGGARGGGSSCGCACHRLLDSLLTAGMAAERDFLVSGILYWSGRVF